MAKSRKRLAKKRSRNQTSNSSKKPARRNFMKLSIGAGIAMVFGTGAVVGLAEYKEQHEIDHDLSVIGNGKPTVVQIHDPSCSMCRQLKSSVDCAQGEFKDSIQFRIANIKTMQGSSLARRHDVPHVTLLLFDAQGKVVRKIRGVRSEEELRPAFKRLAGV